jgi:hypothetical protein
MCTVTLVACEGHDARDGGLLRLVCNRDEQRTRAAALAPVRRRCGRRTAIMPIDPPSGGSWIGANDAGVVACLLNASGGRGRDRSRSDPERRVPGIDRAGGSRSRGEIVPRLLERESVEAAVEGCGRIDPRAYPPFRVLVFERGEFAVVASDGCQLTVTDRGPPEWPVVLGSSGLGDGLVEPARRALFARLAATEASLCEAQRAFHAHRWPQRAHLSVLMSRSDARTVSRTVVDLHPGLVRMEYTPLGEDLRAPAMSSRVSVAVRPVLV